MSAHMVELAMKRSRWPWQLPSPKEIAARQLADAERERLAASSSREYWQAQEDMLKKRIVRLRAELAEDPEHSETQRRLGGALPPV